jgi:hypothetical protein
MRRWAKLFSGRIQWDDIFGALVSSFFILAVLELLRPRSVVSKISLLIFGVALVTTGIKLVWQPTDQVHQTNRFVLSFIIISSAAILGVATQSGVKLQAMVAVVTLLILFLILRLRPSKT